MNGVPTRIIKRGMFGKPTLQWLKNNGTASSGLAEWVKEWRRFGEWTVKLTPGAQSGDDYGSVEFVVNDMRLDALKSIRYVYRMGSTELIAPNVAIHVYDPNDIDNRADITLSHTHDDLGKTASTWYKFGVLPETTGLFYYGNNIPATTELVAHGVAGNLYTLAQFQVDPVFKNYVISKITIEYGYYSTGTIGAAHIAKISVNEEDILLEPSQEQLFTLMGEAKVSPTANTFLGRLEALEGYADEVEGLIGALDSPEVGAGAVGNVTGKLRKISNDIASLLNRYGQVTENPAQYSLLERLKAIVTAIAALGYKFTISGINFNNYTLIKTLWLPSEANSSNKINFQDPATDLDYVVPGGFAFIAYKFTGLIEGVDTLARIGEGIVDGDIVKDVLSLGKGTGKPIMEPVFGVFATGAYIKARTNHSTNGMSANSALYGVEVLTS